ncbi:MAG: hypothetical protein NT092_07590 [Bacteroidia bacterium]|nr:hypothetical protein [Bacteroidia bacterium]
MDNWLVGASIGAIPVGILTAILLGTGVGIPIIGGALLLGGGTWAWKRFFKGDRFFDKYRDHLRQLLDEDTERRRNELQQSLEAYGNKHACEQLEQFQTKIRVFMEILDMKFPDKNQLTYNRYYTIAQEVFLSGIDNLNEVLLIHKTLDAIDMDYIERSLQRLDRQEQNAATKREQNSLLQSKQQYQNQQQDIKNLMAQNEEALSKLDEAIVQVQDIKRSTNNEGQFDMETSMEQLHRIAQQSYKFSH